MTLTFVLLTLKVVSDVTCDVSYLCANFGLSRPLCSPLRPDVRDRQTSDSIIAECLRPIGGGIIFVWLDDLRTLTAGPPSSCVCVCVSVGSHETETDDDTVKMACGRAGWRGRAGGGGATDRPIRPGDYNDRQGTRREGTSGRAPIRIAAARLCTATSGCRPTTPPSAVRTARPYIGVMGGPNGAAAGVDVPPTE